MSIWTRKQRNLFTCSSVMSFSGTMLYGDSIKQLPHKLRNFRLYLPEPLPFHPLSDTLAVKIFSALRK